MRIKTEQLDQELQQTRSLHRLAMTDIKRTLDAERTETSALREQIAQLQSQMEQQQQRQQLQRRKLKAAQKPEENSKTKSRSKPAD